MIKQLLILTVLPATLYPEYNSVEDIPYYPASGDSFQNEQCRLDLYYPTDKEDFATVVWLHPGGLTKGTKSIPQALKNQGIAVISVGYRLSPEVKAPVYIEDAAAGVAWSIKNISRYGGDGSKVYVAGHSAGGYLALMLGLDKTWLAACGIDANQLAGIISFSGHTVTHFTVRGERGIPGYQAIVDELAPLYHVRKDAPELLLITGDRDLEMLGRYEENAYMWRMMQVAGHTMTRLYELDGFDHGNMPEGAFPLLLNYLKTKEK